MNEHSIKDLSYSSINSDGKILASIANKVALDDINKAIELTENKILLIDLKKLKTAIELININRNIEDCTLNDILGDYYSPKRFLVKEMLKKFFKEKQFLI